jgi:hypothetical protein
MSDALPPQDGPSEEEVRAYLGQMRSAPVDQIFAEVVQGLLNAAQVKLGRQDARLLIDIVATMNDAIRPVGDQQLVGQIDQALTQLRLAQVDAEREVDQARSQGHDEPNDIPAPSGGQPSAQEPSPQAPGQPDPSSPLNKLWIPGT